MYLHNSYKCWSINFIKYSITLLASVHKGVMVYFDKGKADEFNRSVYFEHFIKDVYLIYKVI